VKNVTKEGERSGNKKKMKLIGGIEKGMRGKK
jgi:hypothetical protein